MRYFVDERGGCIAVRDRTKVDPDRHGLHSDMECVVWYRMGFRVPTQCPTCSHVADGTWQLTHAVKQEAQSECDRLNAAEAARGT